MHRLPPRSRLVPVLCGAFCLSLLPLAAQPVAPATTNSLPSDGSLATPGATAQQSALSAENDTNIPVASPVTPSALANPAPASTPAVSPQLSATPPAVASSSATPDGWLIAGQLLVLGSVAGLVAYFCGLTRARNCGHTCTLLVAGLVFALLGFWIGGFAMEMGGAGDARADLPATGNPALASLDHELGFYAGGRFWGVMGSAGFFLASDAETRADVGAAFFGQAVLLALAVTAALGGALERARILALAIISFLTGALIFALPANWVWGGGWLAGLGRGGGLGHGVVDLGGAGVIHLSAGVLALVLALELGPRYGRFGRSPAPIPGHNLPLAILGSLAVLIGLTALNSAAYSGAPGAASPAGLAAANTLLAAAAGLAATFVFVLYRTRQLDPTALCRGMLGGAVAVSAGAAIEESWAAVLTGAAAGLIVQAAVHALDRRKIDDPVSVVAVHGAGGAWGLLALGLFANGPLGGAINGVNGPVRGLLTGHDGGQLLAQIIGTVIIGGIVLLLSYACVTLTHKIVGIRVELVDERDGLDAPKLGVLGYQADEELEKED